MTFIILYILIALLILSITIWIIFDMKKTKRNSEEIEKLRELNLNASKALEKIEKQKECEYTTKSVDVTTYVKPKHKKKTHREKLQGGFMNKYDNKMESLSKQLGDSYLLSLDYGKKGNINLVVHYVGNVYKVKFNSRKFNETPNNTIINKIKNEINKKQGGNNNI